MAGKFEPKTPVVLNPPKDDPISLSTLASCNGVDGAKCYVAIKGKVFDVTGNKMYVPGGSYHGISPFSNSTFNIPKINADAHAVFAGHDASRALALTSTKPEDVLPNWDDLPEDKRKVLSDWETFFSKRYNVVGLVEGATNQ
ncbi:putative steroid-binding protein [Lachnellula suecica]|uniref:Putative steroid-binding protein n=1 Tax=Lachnellula suecica TaxID=602035 RepID=A0A8T9CCW0_9HELO|nr:putative steroid-binding protein [Lachnellula suecica]